MSLARAMMSSPPGGAVTLVAALADAVARLAAAGIDDPRREARLLLAATLGLTAAAVLGNPDLLLPPAEQARFAALIARRAAREPTARLIVRREFWSLDFVLRPETLVPRPDSETVVEAALAQIADRAAPHRILDLGTGTGCLLLALLSELPCATGIGVDIVPNAARTARCNAVSLGLAGRAGFFAGAWAAAITGRFDVIVANPPYIPGGTIDALAPEVAHHDPRVALDGGVDGLAAYRVLAPEAARLLQDGGIAVFELGAGQAAAVAAIMAATGLVVGECRRDLAGIERCVVLRKG
jgi:release factor glutamine methyltransferase